MTDRPDNKIIRDYPMIMHVPFGRFNHIFGSREKYIQGIYFPIYSYGPMLKLNLRWWPSSISDREGNHKTFTGPIPSDMWVWERVFEI